MLSSKRYLHLARTLRKSSQKYNNLLRASRVLSKLSGERISGSKKRWFPSQVDTGNGQRRSSLNNIVFRSQGFGEDNNDGSAFKSVASTGRNKTHINSRRMNVLNKLFMEHISSLLATGEISEEILGKGLQISRVRISHDFNQLSVYWSAATGPNMGLSSTLANNALEKELQRCSGILRHELSQLCLMGRVPRITFVRDTFQENLVLVDELLRGLNLHRDATINEDSDDSVVKCDAPSSFAREHLFGLNETTDTREATAITDMNKLKSNDEVENVETLQHSLPAMRHDVFGLDHKGIMLKILGKMRKSKQAWERYNQMQTTGEEQIADEIKPTQDTESSMKAERFQAYLDKCRKAESKAAIPNRKKLRRTIPGIECLKDEGVYFSTEQQQMYEAEDFSEDDEDYDKPDRKQ